MKPKYLETAKQRDRWMVSYVDVLTILLVFFIAATARSLPKDPPAPSALADARALKIDSTKTNAGVCAEEKQGTKESPSARADACASKIDSTKTNAEVCAGEMQGTKESPSARADTCASKIQVSKAKTPLEEALDKLKEEKIEATLETRGLMISLPQAILFAAGDDRVSKDAMTVVGEIAEILRTVPNRVNLTGHADSTPIHNRRFKNNWELSAARGLRLLELLSEKYGIDEARLSVSSDGANRPKESNETPEGRASNRRVEILILN